MMNSDMSRPLLSMFIEPDPADEELLFARQLGVDCVYTWIRSEQRNYDYLARLRERVEAYGLRLYNVGNIEVAKNDKIHLALPGRDRAIADFQAFVRDLGRAGIGVTTFTWEPTQVWSSAPGESRGAPARAVDLDEMLRRPYTHGRAYSEEEIWENYTYFIRQMMPVCEEAGVRLALHPNDPPSPYPLGGIPCLIHSFDTYRRAFAIAGSRALGMEFCCGCWLEGGAGFGDIFEGIRTFAADNRILIVHFRNLPGQRLHGHVPAHEGICRGRLSRHHDPGPFAPVRGRSCQTQRHGLCHRLHARADGTRARRCRRGVIPTRGG
jgi:mannonate dehydratase